MALPVANREPELIGSFTTGAEADTIAPQWTGVKSASMERRKNNFGSCTTGDPHAVMQMDSPAEKDAVVYGVWVAGADGKVAWTDPPTTYVEISWGALRLGHWSICQPSSFEFPSGVDKLVLGVRAFDLAGNPSETAAEVVLDLQKP
jgi:hypothetical protein